MRCKACNFAFYCKAVLSPEKAESTRADFGARLDFYRATHGVGTKNILPERVVVTPLRNRAASGLRQQPVRRQIGIKRAQATA